MKYRQLIEKLDWKGEIVREVSEFEDPAFDIDIGAMLSNVAATGKLDFSLAAPRFTVMDFFSAAGFGNDVGPRFWRGRSLGPGAVMIAGEFIQSISAQFVVFDDRRKIGMCWQQTDHDLILERKADDIHSRA